MIIEKDAEFLESFNKIINDSNHEASLLSQAHDAYYNRMLEISKELDHTHINKDNLISTLNNTINEIIKARNILKDKELLIKERMLKRLEKLKQQDQPEDKNKRVLDLDDKLVSIPNKMGPMP